MSPGALEWNQSTELEQGSKVPAIQRFGILFAAQWGNSGHLVGGVGQSL
jgi:hypothetical protein